MRNVLLILAALAFGFLPAIAAAQYVTLFTLFIPVLLGLIYFVFWRHDWPAFLVPWLFVCAVVGRVSARLWLNSRLGQSGPAFDQFAWTFIVLTAIWYGLVLWSRKTRADRSKSSAKVP